MSLIPSQSADARLILTKQFQSHQIQSVQAQPKIETSFTPLPGSGTTYKGDHALLIMQNGDYHVIGKIQISPSSADGLKECAQTSCMTSFYKNTSVTLTAINSGNIVFQSWGMACAESKTNTCTVKIDSLKQVTVKFQDKTPSTITTEITGSGFGWIKQNTQSVCFDPSCSFAAVKGSTVRLQADADSRTSRFARWSGNVCTDPFSTICEFKSTSALHTITAEFELLKPTPQKGDLGNWKCSLNGSGNLKTVYCSCTTDSLQSWSQSVYGSGSIYGLSPYGELCEAGATMPQAGAFRILSATHEQIGKTMLFNEKSEVRVRFAGSGVVKRDFNFNWTGLSNSSNVISDLRIIGDELRFTITAPVNYSGYYQSNVSLNIGNAQSSSTLTFQFPEVTPADGPGTWSCGYQTRKESSSGTTYYYYDVSCSCSVDTNNRWTSIVLGFGAPLSAYDILNDTPHGKKCAVLTSVPKIQIAPRSQSILQNRMNFRYSKIRLQ